MNDKKQPVRLHVPTIGEQLTLAEDWTFECWFENRNNKFLDLLGLLPTGDSYAFLNGWVDEDGNRVSYEDREAKTWTITLPVGTVLAVDRIYIRKNISDYDSITFIVKQTTHPKVGKKKPRFWVKLSEANNILFNAEG